MCILENGEIEIMDLAIIAAKQVLEMFLMILAGFICFKTGVIKEEGKKALSDLLLYLVVPAMIVNSYLVEHDSSMTGNLVRMLIYSILMVGTGLVITYAVLFSKKNKDRGIMRFACGFSNAAYMGFPLIQALFGAEGILYASVYVTVYNILLWTVGYSFVTKKVNVKEIAKSILTAPCIIAVFIGLILYGLNVHVPDIIGTPLSIILTILPSILFNLLLSALPPLIIPPDNAFYYIIISPASNARQGSVIMLINVDKVTAPTASFWS